MDVIDSVATALTTTKYFIVPKTRIFRNVCNIILSQLKIKFTYFKESVEIGTLIQVHYSLNQTHMSLIQYPFFLSQKTHKSVALFEWRKNLSYCSLSSKSLASLITRQQKWLNQRHCKR